jgi:hypothetical protein
MRRYYKSSKQLQGERYLRDRNLLVSPASLQRTEEIKRKARRTQVKEDAKRVLRLRHTTLIARDQSTQTDNNQFTFLEDDISDTSTEDLNFVPDSDTSFCSVVTRTVTFCLTLLFTLITAIVICTFIGHYLRVYPSYSRLQ